MKEIIIYYSLNGHVRAYVDSLNGEKAEVKTKKKLPTKKIMQLIVLGYKATFNREIPVFIEPKVDISDYSTIHIITPIWAGKVSQPMKSFIKNCQLKDKQIKLTVVCDGGERNSQEDFKQVLDPSNKIIAFEKIINKK